MQLKTVSSLGLAFLLVVGVVGVASAQEVADTRGIYIRVDKPAANTWAKIGDKLEIRVVCYEGRLDNGFRVAVVDSAVADDKIGSKQELKDKIYYNKELKDGAKVTKSGVDTYTFTIDVVAKAGLETGSSNAVKVVVNPTAANETPLNNLMTNLKIAPANVGFGATRVGDGKQFGVDAARPVHGTIFKSFTVDVGAETGVTTDTIGTGEINKVKFTTGDKINVKFSLDVAELLEVTDASSIQVGIIIDDKDSTFSTAPVKLTLSGDKLLSQNTSASTELEAGDFADNQRVKIHAYLVDTAGNLGGDKDKEIAEDAGQQKDQVKVDGKTLFTSEVTFIADATAPKITIKYPIPDSMEDRISARITQTLANYTELPGEVGGHQDDRPLNPLKFRLSEVPYKIKVTHGDSVLTLASPMKNAKGDEIKGATPTHPDPKAKDAAGIQVVEDSLATVDFSAWVDTTTDAYAKATGGITADLKIEVWDSLGNSSSTTLTGITLDGVEPGITNLFPTDKNAPKNADNENLRTINVATKNPAFQIDEILDSLSVRYIEAGGGIAITQGYGAGNQRLKSVGQLMTWPVNDTTTFIERQGYTLQVLAIDLAGNATVESGGTLTFAKAFMNPNADMFKIKDEPDQADKVVAGEDFTLRLSVIDTMLTRIEETDVRAVTYHTPSALAVIVSGNQAGALEGVSFSGTGVSAAPSFVLPAPLAAAGMVARAAILDGDGWNAGQRDVKFKSTKPLANITIMAAEGSIDPATGAYALRISGELDAPVNVSASEFSRFVVTAMDPIATSTVAGAFTVNVVPADEFGNPSMKIDPTTDSKSYESVAATFSTSNAAVTVPSGQQTISAGGSDFGAVAADLDGNATIIVRTVNEMDTGTGDDVVTAALSGNVTTSFVREGGPGPDPGAPAAPASIAVQDYMGADGKGDQGGLVMISFPNSSQHDAVVAYQIYREVDVTTGLDDEGNVVDLDEPVKEWMAWTSISFAADSGDEMGDANGDMQRAVVPALDNVATNWGVRSVGGDGTSDATTAGKRVFTKESIQQALELLGMAPEAVLTDEELMNQFNAPEDYVKSIIGDRKNLIFVPVNPDVAALMGGVSVPGNVRTAAGNLRLSERTATEEPVGAVDNIAPAAVTDASGVGAGGVVLRWTGSTDNRIVGSMPYRGYNVPIMGVKGYTVLRGTSADDLEEIGTLEPGSTQFSDDSVPVGTTLLVYRIDAYDDNNVTMGQLITVDDISIRVPFVDANGDPAYLIVLPSQGGDLEVNFEDFVAFAAAFNSRTGDASYNAQADLDDDGTVDFSDFIAVARSYGRTAVVPAGSKLAISPQRPGVNADTEMTLELTSEKVRVGEEISVTVSMANAKELNGFGLELMYDADKFEFVSAVPAGNDLLKSQGGETPLFRNWPEEGRISVVNAIIESGSVSGEGALVTFTFKVLSEFEDNARFRIAQGVVFDADQLQNPVVSLGALDVQSTPTEFALHQNFPNPFNPQTNIPYDLAESGDVVLRIYNLLGQEVRTLVRERQPAGRYTIQWSGMDDRGVSVSSGIYFYQVSVAGKFQDAKRLMLLK